MHAYSTDAPDREFLPKAFAAGAVAITLFVNWLVPTLGLQVPWWIDAPSVMGFYGLAQAAYDRLLWRQRYGVVRLSAIPDLRGTWAGTIRSSHDPTRTISAVLYIDQTWTKLSVQLVTETSRSRSVMAAVSTTTPELGYEYVNEPGALATDTMHPHRGATHLHLSPDGTTLEGDYYTGRGRQNVGELTFHRVSKETLSRDDALRHAQVLVSANSAE